MTIIKQIFSQNSHWQINKDFARKFGIETTLLLSDLIDKWIYFGYPEWFYNTSDNIESDTTFTRHQQDKCFKILVDNNFIEIDIKGLPAKKHFKVLENNILEFYQTTLLDSRKQVCKKSANLIDENSQTYNKNKGNKNKEDNNKEYKQLLFEQFWKLYDKKLERKSCLSKFMKLDIETINKIIEVVPLYVKSTPDIKYRKHPETWLNGECWNDEIILPEQPNNSVAPEGFYFNSKGELRKIAIG